jgi:hypothetical protein
MSKVQAYDLTNGDAVVPRYALTQFSVDEFFAFWPQLEKTLDTVPHTWRHWTKEYICNSVANNVMQVWGIGPPPKAILVFITIVNVYPTMKVLSIAWGAGTFTDDMLPLLEATLSNFARLNGCEEVEIRGRVGWEPKLKSVGFRREAAVWTRRVAPINVN